MVLLKKINIIFIIFLYIIFNIYNFTYATENVNQPNQVEEPINGEPIIYSESAILIESKTGKVLYQKNINDRKYPASTTKILTAIIAIENCDLNEEAIASPNAIASLEEGYTKADIQVGEKFTIAQLLDVMMLQSANEAATIIAEHISGSVENFSKLMNEKAKEIGCTNSNFVNPNGMHNENHYSTAHDLALIARYCMKNETFRNLANKMECSLPWTEYWGQEQVDEHGDRIFKNTNSLLLENSKYYYPYAIGIKAGFTTPAKNCLISASKKDDFEVIAVVLHAESTPEGLSARYIDTINLFDYGYNNYNIDEILKEYPNWDKPNYSVENAISVPEVQNENNDSTSNDNNLKQPEISYKNDINLTREIAQIAIGIVILIVAIILIITGKRKGKHELNNDVYKFKLY